MAPKRGRGRPKGSGCAAAAAASHDTEDLSGWMDHVKLDSPTAVLDKAGLWAAYRLHHTSCAAHPRRTFLAATGAANDGPSIPLCSITRCLGGLRRFRNTATCLQQLVDRVVGPRPCGWMTDNDNTANDDELQLVLTNRGLKNLGNTCYFNSVLQLLFHIPELRRAIAQVRAGPICDSGLAWTFLQMGFAKYPVVNPSSLVRFLQLSNAQQDAQECLALLVQWLDEASRYDASSTAGPGRAVSAVGEALEAELLGKQLYVRRCTLCGAEFKRVETFSFLSVRPLTHLSDALSGICSTETIDGFRCEKCGEQCAAEGRMILKKLPRTLILHLTRFHFDKDTGQREKLTDNVSFPTTLDMAQWLNGGAAAAPSSDAGDGNVTNTRQHATDAARPSLMYRLNGVINHLGATPHGGHYTYHCRMANDESWMQFDDADTTKLRRYGGENSASRDAYVLVYVLQEETSPTTRSPVLSGVVGPLASRSGDPDIGEFPVELVQRLAEEHAALRKANREHDARRTAVSQQVAEWSSLADAVLGPPSDDESSDETPELYFVATAWLQRFGRMFTEDRTTDPAVPVSGSTVRRPSSPVVAEPHDCDLFVDEDSEVMWKETRCEDPFAMLPPSSLCPHGKLNPRGDFKALSETRFCQLRSSYDSPSALLLSTSNGLCMQCAVAYVREQQQLRADAVLEAKMRDLVSLEDVGNGGFYVNSDVLERWVKHSGEPRNGAASTTTATLCEDEGVEPASNDLSHGLRCPHGGLTTAVPSRAIVAELFDYLTKVKQMKVSSILPVESTEKCGACVDASVHETSVRHGLHQKKLSESHAFVTLGIDDVNRKVFKRDLPTYVKKHRAAAAAAKPSTAGTADDAPCPPRVVEYGCVPTEWADRWRRWMRDDSLTNPVPPPPPVNCASAFCRHGNLVCTVDDLHPTVCLEHYGPSEKPLLTILPDLEYQRVHAAYWAPSLPSSSSAAPLSEDESNATPTEVKRCDYEVRFREVDEKRILEPSPCELGCVEERQKALRDAFARFSNGTISVEGKVRKSKKANQEISETFVGLNCTEKLSVVSELLSTRILEHHGLFVPCTQIHFAKSRSAALRPEEWYDMDASFLSLGIRHQTTLFFSVSELAAKAECHDVPVVAPAAAPATTPQPLTRATASMPAEASFSGSRLSKFELLSSRENGGENSLVPCSVCTFLNQRHRTVCEMCEALLST